MIKDECIEKKVSIECNCNHEDKKTITNVICNRDDFSAINIKHNTYFSKNYFHPQMVEFVEKLW